MYAGWLAGWLAQCMLSPRPNAAAVFPVTCRPSHVLCSQVAAFVSVLDKDLADRTKTSEVDLSPLLPASYASLFKGEVERRLKQVPIAFYQQAPSKLFDINADEDFVGWAPMEAEAVSA